MPARPTVRPFLMLVAATACWGTGTVLSKLALDRGLAPVVLLAVELAASCTFLVLILTASTRARPRIPGSPAYRKVVALGALNPALAYALGLIGLTTISASLAVLIWALEPILVTGLAVLMLRERVSPAVTVLVVAATLGAIVVVSTPGAHGSPAGVALTLAAVVACALYTVLTRRLILDDGSLVVVLGQQVLALALVAVWLVVAVVATNGGAAGTRPDAETLLLAATSGVVYYGGAFAFYVSGLRQVTAASAGAILPLIPVWGLAAAFLAGDRLTLTQWAGAALVALAVLAIGVLESTRKRSHRGKD
jgi:probable blue pigment (indigoidine) exporter